MWWMMSSVAMKTRILVALILCVVASTACSETASAPTPPGSASSSAPESAPLTTVDVAARSARLQGVIDDFASGQAVPFSIVVVDVATGAQASHLADRVLPSASLYKLFVARELLRRIDAGDLSREQPARDGQGRTIGQCVHDMIVVSDNACGAAGLRLVGGAALDDDLHDEGFLATSLGSPQQTSALDVATLLAAARTDHELAELYGLLQVQEVNDRLPQGLPPGTPIAHKTGDIRHYAHDAGVISTPSGDFVLAVLTGPWPLPCCDADHPGESERIAFGAIAQLGRAVYDAIA